VGRVNIGFPESSRKEFESTAKEYGLNMSDYASALISTEIGMDSTEFGREIIDAEEDQRIKDSNASLTLSREQEASLDWLSKKYGMTKNNVIKMLFFINRGAIRNREGSDLVLSSRNDYLECKSKRMSKVNLDIVETHKQYTLMVRDHYVLLSQNKEFYGAKVNPISGFASIYKKTKIRVQGKGDFKKQAMIASWKMWGKNKSSVGSKGFNIEKNIPLSFGRGDVREYASKKFYMRLYNGTVWYWADFEIDLGVGLPKCAFQVDVNSLRENCLRIIF